MFSLWTSTVILTITGLGLHVYARPDDILSFDESPLSIRECSGRPANTCGPRNIGESDCAFLEPRDKISKPRLVQEFDNADNSSFEMNYKREAQTYIKLGCLDLNPEGTEDIKQEDLTAQVKAIRKRSPRRAVRLTLKADAVLDSEVFAPISQQIVAFGLMFCTNPRVTSRLPFLNFTNMLDFALQFCRVPITIRKADFSDLQKIRCIYFEDIRFDTIQPGTFTDLSDLAMFSVKVYRHSDREAMQRLLCDEQFQWLWDWLDQHPALRQERQSGDVYKIGSLQSESAEQYSTDRTFRRVACQPTIPITISNRTGQAVVEPAK